MAQQNRQRPRPFYQPGICPEERQYRRRMISPGPAMGDVGDEQSGSLENMLLLAGGVSLAAGLLMKFARR